MKRMNPTHRNREGLILLIVLGMLAMFSLLAVTYVISAGASRTGSRAALIAARQSNFNLEEMPRTVMSGALRGTNDTQSPFYQNDLLGDVYGPNAIRSAFHVYPNNNASLQNGARLFSTTPIVPSTQAMPSVALAKVSMNYVTEAGGQLSGFEDEYNSRILTILEGPLAGQSFRILKYIGYVHPVNSNGGLPSIAGTPVPDPNSNLTPWSTPVYADANAEYISYSVLIDLMEVKGEQFTGQYFPAGSAKKKSTTLSLLKWISTFGIESLFYQPRQTTSSPWEGYRFVINDAVFNSVGIGVEEVSALPSGSGPVPVVGYGNIDSKRLMRIPTNRPKVSPALLPDYDYLTNPTIMAANPNDGGKVGVDAIGLPRTNPLQFRLSGHSNEGYDVPDYRDMFLSHGSYTDHDNNQATPPVFYVIPSYHRPEVVQHLAHVFGNPASLTLPDVRELLQMIDMSSARVMSYLGVNEGFQQADPNFPRLPSSGFTWSNPPTAGEILTLQNYVLKHVQGPWDVDNDGDGIADSVWIDPGLPIVYSPDGRRLKPLAALLIEDLDGRVNLNAAGDRIQGLLQPDPNNPTIATNVPTVNMSTNANYKRRSTLIPNGFGYGPADISLPVFFGQSAANHTVATIPHFPAFRSSTTRFSFFDELYGARRSPEWRHRPINYLSPMLDRTAGTRNTNDPISQIGEREYHPDPSSRAQHSRLPALPVGRRAGQAMSFDLNGNPAMVITAGIDADSTVPTVGVVPSEVMDDRYESHVTGRANSDDPLGLTELEAVLRRFDADAASLPPRIRELISSTGFTINDYISREITTRSGELRNANIAAVAKTADPALGVTVQHQTPSYLRYIQWLHSQRQRTRTFPNASASDDPELSYAAIAELFPMDFSKGLRMDLNRPFGDGFDNDNDGQVDEPSELSSMLQQELYPGSAPTVGAYTREVKLQAFHNTGSGVQPLASETRSRLASRLILARNLYCLAQLVVPREHDFPGMSGVMNFWERAKLRARALAQWAVNVVDFRDADATMTRFEYDIVPFGIGTTNAASNSSISARPAFWAPDRISYSIPHPGGIPNKNYVGVVWGMEMPEALLSETFAIHDKRVRNTDMDSTGQLTVLNDPNSDPHFDQYRFPEASLFVEITNPRTTFIASDPSVPGAPSSLYTTNGANVVLDLARLAPAAGTWGRQPVWRVAISQDYDVASIPIDNRPGSILSRGSVASNPNFVHLPFTTFQHSIENVGTTSDSAITGITNLNSSEVTNIERYIGNGLVYNYRDPAQTSPESGGFERFIWFTDVEPGTSQPIPDIMPSLRSLSGGQHASVYTARTGNALLRGGGYLVVGPRSTTNIGSLMHNQFTGVSYMQDVGLPPNSNLERIKITAANRNIWSPGYQRIELLNNSVRTHLLNSDSANERLANALLLKRGSPEIDYVKNAQFLICAVDAPVAAGITTGTSGTNWDLSFPGGIGLNISLPTPISDEVNPSAVWYKDHRPVTRLNSTDIENNRDDRTPGWGSESTPPDSWVNLGATPPTGTFPNQPFDHTNPLIGPLNRYKTGTYEHVRTAYLQRLADPDFGYDPVSNPYITVDWMPIDLTVFNGEAPIGAEVVTNGPSGNIMDPKFNDNSLTPNLAFQSRYKNGSLSKLNSNASMAPNHGISYHSPETADLRFTQPSEPPQLPPPPPATGNIKYDAYFGRVIGFNKVVSDWSRQWASGTTLGYTNVGYTSGAGLFELTTATLPPLVTYQAADSNFDGFGVPISNAVEPFRGTTNRIQNLLWYNRPFASPYEVALVPGTSPGQFGLYHSAYSGTERLPFTYMPSFQAMNAWATNNVTPTEHDRSYWSVYEPVTTSSQHMADWHLLLDMVETQPPFADANRYMPPDAVLALSTSDTIAARYLNSYIPQNYSGVLSEPETVRGATLLAPFNKQPNFVAAGKVNLNTVSFDRFGRSRALEAVDYSFSRGVSVTAPFKSARHGYDLANLPVNSFFGYIIANMHPEFPTQFVGAYRPAMTSNIAPALRTPAATEQMRRGYGVETSLLRSADWNAANEANASPATLPTSPMLFNTAGTDDVSRMQQFDRLQRAMRLPNLVTNQSNVFAVWVTVSLFEYDPLTEFGNEYKNQNGQPIRERQFFIIDRSVPVGYRPGENLNSERTVLLQKRL